MIHLIWRCEKGKKNFGRLTLSGCNLNCQLSLGEHNYLHINMTLGLRPDGSKHKLQINFCFYNFLLYLKHIFIK